MITVVIAEDHHLVREGIRALLEKAGDIEVVGEADNGELAIELVRQHRPHVLVTDISMPGLNGLEAIPFLREVAPDTEIVMLTVYSSEIMVRQALRHGARGYILKGSLSDDLIAAVRAARRGATYFSPVISDTVLGDLAASQGGSRDQPGPGELTPREKEILQLICDGYTNNAIGEKLHISVKTVERHRANLMGKLGARNLVGLIRAAVRYGLVVIDP